MRLSQRCQRDLTQIELQGPHHAAKGAGDDRHFLEFEPDARRRDSTVLEPLDVRIIRQRSVQREGSGHGVIQSCLPALYTGA